MRTVVFCVLSAALAALVVAAFFLGRESARNPIAGSAALQAASAGAPAPIATPAAGTALGAAAGAESQFDVVAFRVPAGWKIVETTAETVAIGVSATDTSGGCAISRAANPLGRMMSVDNPQVSSTMFDRIASAHLRDPRLERNGRRAINGVDWVETSRVGTPLKGATRPDAMERLLLLMTGRGSTIFLVVCGYPLGGDPQAPIRADALIESLRFAG